MEAIRKTYSNRKLTKLICLHAIRVFFASVMSGHLRFLSGYPEPLIFSKKTTVRGVRKRPLKERPAV